jgi:MoxR-like ATPase
MGDISIENKVKGFTKDSKTNSGISIKQRLERLLKQIGEGLHEREQILAVSLLGAISGQNTFLHGPPGTAKSLISRRLASAFKEPNYFEYLMNRFSTPEEVFGPVSIKELKEDKYIRQIEGYLPTADFAFLDEIWKSSPAILNTLLTIINEQIFKNGNGVVEVPLKTLIAASNEVPADNQGLDALYDRFVIRLPVPPIKEEKHFNAMLNNKPLPSKPAVIPELTIDYRELSNWQHQLHNVKLSDDTLLIIKYIRKELAERFEELSVYVSDRRWQRVAMLLKASAFCNEREQTNHTDVVLLKHCLWTSPDNQKAVAEIVMQSIKDCGFSSDVDLAALDNEKESLDREIHNELYFRKDVYKTVAIDDKQYFKTELNFLKNGCCNKQQVLIDCSEFKSKNTFNPIDQNGNNLKNITVSFDNQGACTIRYDNYYNYEKVSYIPEVMFHKGDKKEDVNFRLVKSLAGSVAGLRKNLMRVLETTEHKLAEYRSQLESPFVAKQDTDVALSGILEQVNQLKLRIKDCKRLEALCN